MTDQRKGSDAEPTTHFGFKNVPESQKAEKVAEVFHSVAAKYDLMNDVLSGGMHRLWKRFTIELSGVRTGNRVLDIAGGTGDLAAKFSKLVGPTGQVVLADINGSMLKVGRDRLLDKGVAGNIEFVQADAEKLPFPDNHFDCVTIAFGLRNVTHKEDAIRSMLRVLKPGGRLLVLEFSKPTNALMSKVYDTYSFAFMPLMGKLITNDAESYRYLAESIRMHPDQETLKSMMVEAGFDRVSVAFGQLNMTHKDQALAEMRRVLKPGGKLLVLEFSKVIEPLQKPYDLYSFKVLPWMGQKIAGDAESYRYLAESIRMHPDQETLKTMMETAGLETVKYYNLTAGVAALHTGIKL